MAWDVILFDLDDTLYPELDFVASGFQAVADWLAPQLGRDPRIIAQELEALRRDGRQGHVFDTWIEDHSVSGVSVDDLVSVYRQHHPRIRPFAEMVQLLDAISPPTRLGLVSDGYLPVQTKKWEALDLGKYFQAVVFSDALGREFWKPHPRPFEVILANLGIDPRQAVYVADNPAKDFIPCRILGMDSIRVRSPRGLHRDAVPPPEGHPGWTVNSVTELGVLLQSGSAAR